MRKLLIVAVSVMLAPVSAASDYQWLDVSGNPLPFETEEQLLDYLRTADVVDEKGIGKGINQSVKLTLEQDGVRAHAIFREGDTRKRTAHIQGEIYRFFADSYLFECAAYELAKLLDMPLVPPVVLRHYRGRRGSLQIWIEETLDEEASDFRPPRAQAWVRQLWDMFFFDNLVYNIDRNSGNILVTPDYHLFLIDHTRAFQFKFELLDDKVMRVPRRSWDLLVGLSDADLDAALSDFLTPKELRGVRERKALLIEYVESMIAERGADAVFY